MSVTVVVFWYMKFGLSTDIDSLRVKLMQIEQESQVIVHELMSWIYLDAFPPVLNCWVV